MSKIDEARDILIHIGMPTKQQTEIACLTLLALAHIEETMLWFKATNDWIRIHDVLGFSEKYYNKKYAENTRETIRKYCMHQFREAAIIEDNGKATNSPNYQYRLTVESLELLRSYGTNIWGKKLANFLKVHETLISKYSSKKKQEMMPVKINQEFYKLSTGKHNSLQKAILEQFAPRFAPNSECLYVGDTTNKDLFKNSTKLKTLGFDVNVHNKMPDVILYREDKNWLYFIEAVTSVGPMSAQRVIEIKRMTNRTSAGKIYVTAFPDFATYKKFSTDLAWETEVWIANNPDHMIHLNGNRFMGPHDDI